MEKESHRRRTATVRGSYKGTEDQLAHLEGLGIRHQKKDERTVK